MEQEDVLREHGELGKNGDDTCGQCHIPIYGDFLTVEAWTDDPSQDAQARVDFCTFHCLALWAAERQNTELSDEPEAPRYRLVEEPKTLA